MKAVDDINSQDLLKRWTIELTSLRSRTNPTGKQQDRVRELQSFLAALDPLRKHEFDWRSIPEFDKRFTAEIEAQRRISAPRYRKRMMAKVLTAFSGSSKPEPGCLCSGMEKAKQVAGDHGENFDELLVWLIDNRYLRQEGRGQYSMSTVGCNLIESSMQNNAKPDDIPRSGSTLFDRLKPEIQTNLGVMKADYELSSDSAQRIMPTVPAPKPARVQGPSKASPPRSDSRNAVRSDKSKANDLFQFIATSEKIKRDSTSILCNLVQKRLIPNFKLDFVVIEEEPFTIWRCDISLPLFPGRVFSGTGRTQVESRKVASCEAVRALKCEQQGSGR